MSFRFLAGDKEVKVSKPSYEEALSLTISRINEIWQEFVKYKSSVYYKIGKMILKLEIEYGVDHKEIIRAVLAEVEDINYNTLEDCYLFAKGVYDIAEYRRESSENCKKTENCNCEKEDNLQSAGTLQSSMNTDDDKNDDIFHSFELLAIEKIINVSPSLVREIAKTPNAPLWKKDELLREIEEGKVTRGELREKLKPYLSIFSLKFMNKLT